MLGFIDPDRTYDILFAQKIKGQILTLLTNAISTKGIFGNPFPIALIEREAPGALNPWAFDWSGKMFEFLKKLSLTHILDDGYLNGSAYGFEPEYTANLPSIIDLEEYHADKITVRVPSGAVGVLTWLERTHDEQSAPYCDKLTNTLTIAMRRSRLFKNTAGESLEIELSTRNWLHNSVCFQGIELQGLTANQAKFLLYDSMESFLDYLWGLLDISQCKVLTGMTATLKTTFSVNVAERNFAWAVNRREAAIIKEEIFYSSPLFQVVPDDYYHAYFGKTGTISGKSPTAIYDKSNGNLELALSWDKNYFNYWLESQPELIGSPSGYSINDQSLSGHNGGSVIELPPPYSVPGLDYTFGSYKNHFENENNAPRWPKTNTYPPPIPELAIGSIRPANLSPNAELNTVSYFEFELTTPQGTYTETINAPSFGNPSWSSPSFIGLPPFLLGSTSVLTDNNGSGSTERITIRKKAVCINFYPGDLNLFRTTESAVILNDYQLNNKYSVIFEGTQDQNRFLLTESSGKEIESRLTAKIVFSYADPQEAPAIAWEPYFSGTTIRQDWEITLTPPQDFSATDQPLPVYEEEEMETSIILQRRF